MKKLFTLMAAACLMAGTATFTSCSNGEDEPQPYDVPATQTIQIDGVDTEVGQNGNPFGAFTPATEEEDYVTDAQVSFGFAIETASTKVNYYEFVVITDHAPKVGDVYGENSYLMNYTAAAPTSITYREYEGGQMVVTATDPTNSTITIDMQNVVYAGVTYNGSIKLPFWF